MIWNNNKIEKALNLTIKHAFLCERIEFNSQNIKQNELFIALKGENGNGHHFIADALVKGAVAVIAEYVPDNAKEFLEKIIIVEDSFEALKKLAAYKRNNVNAKYVALTGSVGKTTTKEMLACALQAYGKVHKNYANYNSMLGMLLTLANMPFSTEFAVLELGMYHTGEIKEMVDFLKPNIAIITTIAATHLANFKNIYGIADAKAEIYYNLSDEKLAIIPDGEFNDYLTKIAQNYTKNIYKISDFVTINDYFFDYNCNQTHIKLSLKQHKFIFFISALGKQYVENIKNIVATLDGLQLDITIGLNALKNYNVIEGRGNELRLKINNKQVILIDESYNSSPKSLENAIYNLTEIYKTKRKILIISDMLELGKDEILLHQEISKYPNFNQIEMVITVGKLMEHLHQEISNIFHFNDYKELINDGFKFVQEDDVILLKGSNSTNIKKVVQFLKEKSVE